MHLHQGRLLRKQGMPVKLNLWCIAPEGEYDPYRDPSTYKGVVLCGVVTGHPKHPDGSTISTSRVERISSSSGVAVTQNNTYALGSMDPKYERWRKRHGQVETVEYVHGQLQSKSDSSSDEEEWVVVKHRK